MSSGVERIVHDKFYGTIERFEVRGALVNAAFRTTFAVSSAGSTGEHRVSLSSWRLIRFLKRRCPCDPRRFRREFRCS
jgi:hypothetical protein